MKNFKNENYFLLKKKTGLSECIPKNPNFINADVYRYSKPLFA